MLAHRAVLITVSKLEEGDLLQINICPRQLKEGENQALTAPLCITGTAIELDEELVPQIATFVASHAGLNSNLIQIQKEIEEAEKAAREEAKKKRPSSLEFCILCERFRPFHKGLEDFSCVRIQSGVAENPFLPGRVT